MNAKKLQILFGLIWFSIAGLAHSMTTESEVSFVGWNYTLLGDGATNFENSTGISFSRGSEFAVAGTGEFAFLDDLNQLDLLTATFGTITYHPFPSIPATPGLWSFQYNGHTYSFDLSAGTVAHRSPTEIVLTGEGKLNIDGVEEADGKWNFTGNTYGARLSFSSGSIATPIAAPEIDAASGTSAIALLVGVLLLMAERSRRSVITSASLGCSK